jgi:Glycosyltransferases involved in cell wall biogenesis
MVKNEEKYFQRCLASLQPLRDAVESELIIVDTGSTDSTVEIAKHFTDKIYFHPWNNDFSAMRNITLSYAKGEWIYITDGDEILEVSQPLIDFLHSPKRNQYGAVAITGKNIVDLETDAYSSQVGFRLFKNDGYFHYEGAVHNQAVFKGKTLAIPEVSVLHYGYVANDKEMMERKFLRTSAILHKELEKDPENIYYWTQLSVTYAMHNDYIKAIEYAEKAYSLLPEIRTPNYMSVFLQLILVYQHQNQYDKVAQICRESLSIKEGYLDVYYYYAESQAMLDNYPEAMQYFEKYLHLLEAREQQQERDVTVIEYSLTFVQLVYFNMSRMAKREGLYDQALYYAEKITDEKYFGDNILTIIELYIATDKINEMRTYFETRISGRHQAAFYEQLAKVMEKLEKSVKIAIAHIFSSINSEFGLLCRLIEEDHNGYISSDTQFAVEKLEFVNIPVYCSDILFYLLKWDCALTNLITDFKEVWLGCAFDYIAKYHEDLCEYLYAYLEKHTDNKLFCDCKLNKILARYTLLLNKLDDEQYSNVFAQYIQEGIAYLQTVYSIYVIDSEMVYELKNDEEVFLLYMYYAGIHKETDKGEYARYLRMAVTAFPEMKRGVEILLQELQSENALQQNEFDVYKIQVKDTIRQLIDSGNLDEAKAILGEYKSVVPNDMEAILLESKILLN